MSKRVTLFICLFSLTAIVAVVLPFYSAHAALVPCGTSDNPRMCNFCDFFTLIDNVKNFLLVDVMTPVAVLFIVIGGIMVLTGGAKPGNITQGRKIITDTVIGIFVIFSAWMITNTIIQLFTGDSNLSQNWYKISCTVTSDGGGGPGIGGSGSPTPAPSVSGSVSPTPSSPVSGGDTLVCPNWKSLVKLSSGVGWERCTNDSGGTCLNCVSINGSSKKASKSLGDFLNNKLTPALQAAGVAPPYYNDGMCPTGHHANCAHFNGHAMDISGQGNTSRTEKICQVLNSLGVQGSNHETSAARNVYIVESANPRDSNPNSACPPTCGRGSGSCGSGIHINM